MHGDLTIEYMCAIFTWMWLNKKLSFTDKEFMLKRTVAENYQYAENVLDINIKNEFPLDV